MRNNSSVTYLPIILSFAVAFSLMIIPVSQNLKWLRPDLVTLLLIYWVIGLPNYVGIIFAFLVGVTFDLLTGLLLGSMGLTLSVVAFLTINLRMRLKIYRYWQRFAVILLLVAIAQLIRLWIQILVGHPPANFMYWFCSIVSAFAWPIVYIVLDTYQRALRLA